MVVINPYIPERCPHCGRKEPVYHADVVTTISIKSDGAGGIWDFDDSLSDDCEAFMSLQCDACEEFLISDGEAVSDEV